MINFPYAPRRIAQPYNTSINWHAPMTVFIRIALMDALNAFAAGIITWQEFCRFQADITSYVD